MFPILVYKLNQDEKLKALNNLQRGDVIEVDLTKGSLGKEQKKLRPCVIVSNNALNKNSETIVVVPITSHDGNSKPALYDVEIPPNEGGLTKPSFATPHKLRNIDPAERVKEIWGRLSDQTMFAIDRQMEFDLGLQESMLSTK